MTSFVFQPWKEDEAPSSPLHHFKDKEAVTSSTVIKRTVKSSIRSSLNRTPDTLKKSITLEQRGITYGKKVESTSSIQQADQIRRNPKIDCSNGPSEMIQLSAVLLSDSYVDNSSAADISSVPVAEKEGVGSLEEEGRCKVGGAVAQVNGEVSVGKEKQRNSSAIRYKKYESKVDVTAWILLLILILLLLSVKTQAGKQFFNENLLPLYQQYLYTGLME